MHHFLMIFNFMDPEDLQPRISGLGHQPDSAFYQRISIKLL